MNIKRLKPERLLVRSATLSGVLLVLSALTIVPGAVAAASPLIVSSVNTPGSEPGVVTLRGYVTPEDSTISACRFDYGLDANYGHSAACVGADEVQRLRVRAAGGTFNLTFESQTTPDLPFDASAGEVQAALEVLSSIGAGNVAVSGGPGNGEGLFPYRIDFQGSLGQTDVPEITVAQGSEPLQPPAEGPARATIETLLGGDSPYGSGTEPLLVQVHMTGLIPGTRYHYRLTATNGVGTEAGTDGTFVTPAQEAESSCANEGLRSEQHSVFLPDCRAYEMVSPSNKGGADITAASQLTQVAADGNAAMFASLGAFGDAVGTGVQVEYESLRSADPAPGGNGWSTHAITPPQRPLGVNVTQTDSSPRYEGEFSPDLSHGVFFAWSALTDDPYVAEAQNIYLRDDLRSPGPGSYELLTPCSFCEAHGIVRPTVTASSGIFIPYYDGASSDYTKIVLEQYATITTDAPPQSFNCELSNTCRPRAYEWDRGQLRYAGFIPPSSAISCGPGDTACMPAAASILGAGRPSRSAPLNVISSNGRYVFFTVPTNNSGTIVEPREFEGRIYVRTDGESTDEITASERTDCAGDPTCGGDGVPNPSPEPYSPSRFWMASPDGSRVFFTSFRALTDDAQQGSRNLYMYDTAKPASDPHNLTLLNSHANVVSVIGIGDQGHYVYFTANPLGGPPLVPGVPKGEQGFYVWNDGQIGFIGLSMVEESSDLSAAGLYDAAGPPQGRVTPDGRHLLLSTHAGADFPIAYEHGVCPQEEERCRQLYLYSAETGELSCASCVAAGGAGTGAASSSVAAMKGAARLTWRTNGALSDDGRYLFFSTAQALVPQDTNGVSDAYVYDSLEGRDHLLSSGTDSSPSYFMDATPNGHDALFVTRQRLVGWDTDGSYDLYDARVGGGFPEPPPVPSACSGESCRGAAALPPAVSAAATATFRGLPNSVASRRCPKGRRAVVRNGRTTCRKLRPRKKHRQKHGKSSIHRRVVR